MSPTTIFFGKLLGFSLIAISIGTLVNRQETLETLDEIARSGPWMLFAGIVAAAVGSAMVVGHYIWTGGALAVAVTIVGWAALLRGLVLLMVPPSKVASADNSIGYERFFYAWTSVVLLLGLWITLEAFAG